MLYNCTAVFSFTRNALAPNVNLSRFFNCRFWHISEKSKSGQKLFHVIVYTYVYIHMYMHTYIYVLRICAVSVILKIEV